MTRQRIPRALLPGDQVTLPSGRVVVLTTKLIGGDWQAQYLEDAGKRNADSIIVRAAELSDDFQ